MQLVSCLQQIPPIAPTTKSLTVSEAKQGQETSQTSGLQLDIKQAGWQ